MLHLLPQAAGVSTASNVVPLRHRAATRLGPKEARRLSIAAVSDIGTARYLLAFFLRTLDPRRGYTSQFSEEFLADELGVTDRTIRRAFRRLERLGLAHIKPGTGRTWTTITLDADRLRAISLDNNLRNPLVNTPVPPGETSPAEGGQGVRPGGTGCPPRADKLPAPNARAREEIPDKYLPPNPPASRGADVCSEHGAGCARRRCGRAPRQVAEQERRDLAARKRAAAEAAYRARTDELKAGAEKVTPEMRTGYIAQMREGLRPKKSTPTKEGTE